MKPTWIQVMRLARTMDADRRRGRGIDTQDAEQLVTMLLDLQRHALATRSGEPPTDGPESGVKETG
jgi:hypothetical protein